MSIKISIIIPFYNNSDTILRALKSVRNQSIAAYEIIIINDASPDWEAAKQIIEKQSDLPILILEHKKNKNGSAARNTGIKRSKGEYLAFLDADDEWVNDHLKKSLEKAIQTKAKFIYSKCLIKSKHPDLILPSRSIREKEKISSYLFTSGQAIFTPSFFISAELFKIFLFDESLIRHQDFDFLFQLEKGKEKPVFSDHTGAIVHWEDNVLSSKGENWEYSMKWAEERKSCFTEGAWNNFIIQFVVLKLINQEQKWRAFNLIINKKVNLFRLSNRNLYNLVLSFVK